MKASNPFETAIKTYLDAEINNDPELATAVQNKDKNLTDCCSYIMGEVKKLGVSAMTNDEVFSLAKTYYLTKDLAKPKPVNGRVVVGGDLETVSAINKAEAEKKTAHKDAAPKKETTSKIKKAKEAKPADGTQLSLFELMS